MESRALRFQKMGERIGSSLAMPVRQRTSRGFREGLHFGLTRG